jgi:protein-S-isoprenylcysteine O-methyltransferase Ste14
MSLSIVWLVSYCIWVASEIFIAIATRTRKSSGNVRDRGTMVLLWGVLFTSITAGIWFSDAHGPNPPDGVHWLKTASLFVLLAGLALRWWAIVSLGKSFSSNAAIHATQSVHKSGLYGWMRHPSYTGLLLCIFAVALHTRNWISFLIIALPSTTALLYRIHIEEAALRDHFGPEYVEYSRKTKRLLPGIY